jgi:hypothetical protein
VLERAAKKGLMKGTKRSKTPKHSKIPSEPKDKQQLDEIPKRLENLSLDVTDEKESNLRMESKEEQRKLVKKGSMKPFQF